MYHSDLVLDAFLPWTILLKTSIVIPQMPNPTNILQSSSYVIYLIFETILLEMVCCIFQYLLFKTFFCLDFLNAEFSRVLDHLSEVSFPSFFSESLSSEPSLKAGMPQASTASSAVFWQHAPLREHALWCGVSNNLHDSDSVHINPKSNFHIVSTFKVKVFNTIYTHTLFSVKPAFPHIFLT